MLRKLFGITFVGLLLATSSIKCDEDAADNEATNFAVELNAENFNEALQKNNHFIMFFAPWCGHCKRLHPLWEQLAEMMNVKDEPKVIIAKVDCTKEQTLCGNNEITGYPTLRFFKLGATESVKFKGTRDMPAITEFINQQLDSEEDNELPQNGDGNAAAGDSQQAALYELTEDNFAKHVSTGNHFVKFYAPWCSHCQRLAPTWDKLAESLKSEQSVSIAKIDCTVYRPVCQDFDVKGYPTLLWIEDGKKIEKYSGSRDHEALKDYVEKMLGSDSGRKEAAPEEAEAKPTAEDKLQVLQLSGDNFAKSVETGVTFVKFYAPWCGHCQKLSPTWDQLAAKLHAVDNGIKIAKVDCTAADNRNLCSDEQVEGYPTLFAYKDGVKQTEYNGGRSLADLQHYISNMQGHTEL